MAQARGIRIQQCLDDFMIAPTKECCHHDTQTGLLCQDLGWLANLLNLKLEPKQLWMLPVRPITRGGQTYPRLIAGPGVPDKIFEPKLHC